MEILFIHDKFLHGKFPHIAPSPQPLPNQENPPENICILPNNYVSTGQTL